MILLVSGATKTVDRISDPRLGKLFRPGQGNIPDERPWAIDNGAFSGFDEHGVRGFRATLKRLSIYPGCLWVVAPDVVGDHVKTAALFEEWAPQIRELGYRVAWVAQDGSSTRDIPECDAVFIGGSTAWKLSITVERIALEAKARGKWLHVGRVNTIRRMAFAVTLDADSIDGTKFSMFPDTWVPWGLKALADVEKQCSLGFYDRAWKDTDT